MRNFEELTDSEVEQALADLSRKFYESPESISDEEKFSDESLLEIITIVHYLRRSGIVPNAEAVYSELYKTALNELTSRLGELPYTDLT
jgi:hypothetical protein